MNTNIKYSLVLMLILSLGLVMGCSDDDDKESATYMDVTPVAAMDLMNEHSDLIIIDVSPMYAQGHIPGALNFPLGDGSFEDEISNWDQGGKYLIYCHTDQASISAAQMLINAGFDMVYRLEGNYGAWVNAGYGIDYAYQDISPEEAYSMVMENDELIIIDVSPMFYNGHIPGALNFPLGDGTFEAEMANWDMMGDYLIYCHGDGPSMTAAQLLIDAGFKMVYRLEGNYGAWIDSGYDVDYAYKDISVEEAYNMTMENENLIIIDVSNMYAQGHLPGSLNFPLGDGTFEAEIVNWDMMGEYLIYCHGDNPAITAAQLLVDNNFMNVYRLEGNYGAWVAAGYPIETGN